MRRGVSLFLIMAFIGMLALLVTIGWPEALAERKIGDRGFLREQSRELERAGLALTLATPGERVEGLQMELLKDDEGRSGSFTASVTRGPSGVVVVVETRVRDASLSCRRIARISLDAAGKVVARDPGLFECSPRQW